MEQLDGGERQYQCQRCKQKVKALKQLTVDKAPYVLTIHLKRFGSHIAGQKIDKKVEFGPTLDLKPFVSGPHEGDLKYTLYGVLVHAGWSTHSGHYYCFVRTSSGMWHSLDDNRVVQVSERTVLEQKAYMLFYVRDRRSLATKKPVVVRKEETVAIAIESKDHSVSTLGLKETVQNVLIGKRLNTSDCSATIAQRDALGCSSSKDSLLKEGSVQKTNDLVKAVESVLLKDPLLEPPLKEPLLKDSVNGPSVLHSSRDPFVAEGLPQSAPSLVKQSKTSSCPATVSTGDTKINYQNEHNGSKMDSSALLATPSNCNGSKNSGSGKLVTDTAMNKDSSALLATPSNCNGSQNSGSEKLVTDTATNKIGVVLNERPLGKEQCERVSNPKLEGHGAVRLSNRSSMGKNQNGGISKEMGPSDLVCQKAGENDLILNRSVDIASQSSMVNGCVQKKAPRHHRKVPKPNKKLVKCRVTRMHLGSKLLLGTFFSMRKKKKHKKSKRRNLELRDLTEEDLMEQDCISRGMEPTTSEKTRMVALNSDPSGTQSGKSIHNKGNGCVTAKDVKNSSDNSSISIIDGDFRERISQASAVLATNEPPLNSSSSNLAVNRSEPRRPDNSQDKNRFVVQNGLISMLTRGLGEFAVARWDDVELPPSQIVGSSSGQSLSIGYVPDEWDEEYDRGKRKKVRSSKNSFGELNPFQEVATMKAQLKKVKIDRSSSGNQPFRI